MNQFFTKQKARLFISLVLILFITCEKDATKSVFVENPQVKPEPVVTNIEPADSSLSGITQITISGSNFSPVIRENAVFFGSTIATVLSASESQLVVRTPRIVGDSIEVRVGVVGAQLFSNIRYYNKIVDATREYGGYGPAGEDLYAIAADAAENVYVAALVVPQFRIDIINPDSSKKATFYGRAPVVTTGMKVGPGGYLYLTKNNTTLYRIPPGGGNQVPFSALPQKAYDLDFDPVGNIYAAGDGDSLIIVYPDGSNEGVAGYTHTFIKAVRVYNGYVYVAGNRKSDSLEAVWRNQINAPNDLGPNEMVFDLTAELGKDVEIRSMTFDEYGDMYIGTTALDPILIVHPGGGYEPLYPGILSPEMYSMAWGNDIFLYVTRRASALARSETRVLRITMQKKGAPYYGREL